jgi:hypothetical protein
VVTVVPTAASSSSVGPGPSSCPACQVTSDAAISPAASAVRVTTPRARRRSQTAIPASTPSPASTST